MRADRLALPDWNEVVELESWSLLDQLGEHREPLFSAVEPYCLLDPEAIDRNEHLQRIGVHDMCLGVLREHNDRQ